MWKRWHQTTHIWERSVDNGATWGPLPLNASTITEGTLPDARLSSNVALKNIDNSFVAQNFAPGTTLRGTHSMFYFIDPGAPVDWKVWRLLNYQGTDTFRFEALTDNLSGVVSTPLQIQRTGGNIHVQGDVIQLGRTQAMGNWHVYTYRPYDWTSALEGNIYCSLVGKTMTMIVNASGTIGAGVPYLRMNLPIGGSIPYLFSAACSGYTAATGWVPGIALGQPGQTFIDYYWGSSQSAWPSGSIQIRAAFSFPIA